VETIVEGVETAEVRDLVKRFGANKAQGYFFARPAPFDDLVALLRQAGR
jgi:EAL domain-containing protein (putative c-di-GMP-specific phosphodiesterase class I)